MERNSQPTEEVGDSYAGISALSSNSQLYCRNGTVRFESVMRLREQLDRLGKMKGIAQDEKGIV